MGRKLNKNVVFVVYCRQDWGVNFRLARPAIHFYDVHGGGSNLGFLEKSASVFFLPGFAIGAGVYGQRTTLTILGVGDFPWDGNQWCRAMRNKNVFFLQRISFSHAETASNSGSESSPTPNVIRIKLRYDDEVPSQLIRPHPLKPRY